MDDDAHIMYDKKSTQLTTGKEHAKRYTMVDAFFIMLPLKLGKEHAKRWTMMNTFFTIKKST